MPNFAKPITLDLSRLIEDKLLSKAEAMRLFEIREPDKATNRLASILYILGALAAAAGVILLKPTATTGLIIAIVCFLVGQTIRFKRWDHLHILSLALGIGSAAGLTGWFVLEFGETLPAIAVNGFATAVTLSMALAFRSRFLGALVPLGIGSMIGSGGAYWHASYGIFVREPAVTILLFATIAAALFFLARRSTHPDWRPMSTIAASMSLVVVNFGWWVGSLWGDYIGDHLRGVADRSVGEAYQSWYAARQAYRETALHIDDSLFAIGWAGSAVAMIVVGRKLRNRFVEIAGIVFLAINAFTQYFQYFRDEPWALVFGGLALVGVALGPVRLETNRREVAMAG